MKVSRTVLAIAGTLGTLLWLEKKRPLRVSIERADIHNTRNVMMGALSATAIALTERPLLRLVPRHEKLPLLVTVVLLDYTLYLWHRLTHQIPFLWRFHEVHHRDLDLTATTAWRFHFGEMILSVPYRLLQAFILGASERALRTWQTLTLLEIMFHHSNLRLPEKLESLLSKILVTPRLHGIHHSVNEIRRHSNFSSGLTFWDFLHGTLLTEHDSNDRVGTMGTHMVNTHFRTLLSSPFSEHSSHSRL